MIRLRFEGLPPSPNATTGKHWAELYKIKKEWQDRVGWEAKAAALHYRLKPFVIATVHFHISTGDKRRHDPDNLAWSVTKVALDGLKGILLEDDSIDNITLTYTFDRAKPRGFVIEVDGA